MPPNSPGLNLKGNYLQRIPGGADLATTQNTLNEVINRLNDMLQTQIFSDGTNKRMLIGFQLNGWGSGKNFGIKISMEGIDVTTATDAQLLFKMDLETWKWQDPTGRAFVNLGLRKTGTYGFEMAKPTQDLNT
jgi:hypothetical protein